MNPFHSVTPVLPSRDIERTIDFYARLGFRLSRRDDDDYLVLHANELELHFFPVAELNSPLPRAGLFIRVAHADQLHSQYLEDRIPGLGLLIRPSWGISAFHLSDPDGNHLQFAQLS